MAKLYQSQPKPRGVVTRLFKMTCGICQGEVIQSCFKSMDGFIESMTNQQWRVSEEYGYIHRRCLKQLPTEHQLKFT